jgi:hypothetical protein
MHKYDLNYLMERHSILSEMSKIRTTRPEKDENVVRFLKDVKPAIAKILFTDWKPASPIKTLNDFIVEFLYYKIYNIDFPYDTVDKYFKYLMSKSPKLQNDYKDYIQTGSNDSNKRNQWLLSYLANQLTDELTTPEFFAEITDTFYIEKWKTKWLARQRAKNRAKGYINKIESNYGTSIDEFLNKRGEVWPIIVKINRKAKRYMPPNFLKTIRSEGKYDTSMQNSTSSDGALDPNYALDTIISVLEDFISYEVDNYELIVPLLDGLKQDRENGVEVPKEEIEARIEQALDESDPDLSLEVFEEFDYYYEIGTSESEIEDAMDYKIFKSSLEFYTDEFLDMLISKNIINDKEKAIVNKWRDLIVNDTIDDQPLSSGLSKKDELGMLKTLRDREYKQKGDEMKLKKVKKTASKELDKEYENKSVDELNEMLNDLLSTDDPDFEKINALADLIAKMEKGTLKESSIMSYMTEQIEKDRLTNKVGEYKDRGFKKPKNYHHWMMINE